MFFNLEILKPNFLKSHQHVVAVWFYLDSYILSQCGFTTLAAYCCCSVVLRRLRQQHAISSLVVISDSSGKSGSGVDLMFLISTSIGVWYILYKEMIQL